MCRKEGSLGERRGRTASPEREIRKGAGAHLVDVSELVDDLVHHRVHDLHFDLRVAALGFDAAAHHAERVAVVRRTTLFSQ